MENASKALIIAGAILLAILIISLGIFIFGQARGAADVSAINQVEIQAFNGKFTQYAGENITGAQVNQLLEAIVSNNISNQSDTSRQIKLKQTGDWQTGTKGNDTILTTSPAKALTGRSYKVTCTPDKTTGLITSILIESKAKN